MRIDIIHRRDPDSECDHEIYVDGKRVGAAWGDTIAVYDFDPGRGTSMAEFEENKAADVEAAPDFLKDRLAQIWDEMKPSYEKWSYDT